MNTNIWRDFQICISVPVIDNNTDIYLSKYLRMDQVRFVEDSLYKILLGPFLNTVSSIYQSIFQRNFYWLYLCGKLIYHKNNNNKKPS